MGKKYGFKSVYRQLGGAYDGGLDPSQWGGAYDGGLDPSQWGGAYDGGLDPSQWGGVYDGGLDPSQWGDDQRGGARTRRTKRKRKDDAPPAAAKRRRGGDKAFLDQIRPSSIQLRARHGGIRRNPNTDVRDLLLATKTLRKGGLTKPHGALVGWYLHGNKAGQPRKGRKADLLRQATALALTAFRRGKKTLDPQTLKRMRPFLGQARAQKGGILPLAAALPALALAGKTLGLGALAGGGSALAGGLLGKLFK